MSYYSSPEINEERTGITTIEVECGEEYIEKVLTVRFTYHEWSEGHPCGDIAAYEQLSEVGDETYELDGMPVNYDHLTELLTLQVADEAISDAMRNAE